MPTIYTRQINLAGRMLLFTPAERRAREIVSRACSLLYSDIVWNNGAFSDATRDRNWSDEPFNHRYIFQTLDEVGHQTSLAFLQKAVRKNGLANFNQSVDLNDIVFDSQRSAQLFWQFFNREYGNAAQFFYSIGSLCQYRREYKNRLNITSDCRTHRDVPRRNMLADKPADNAVAILRRNPRQAHILSQLLGLDEVHSIDQLRNCLAAA